MNGLFFTCIECYLVNELPSESVDEWMSKSVIEFIDFECWMMDFRFLNGYSLFCGSIFELFVWPYKCSLSAYVCAFLRI